MNYSIINGDVQFEILYNITNKLNDDGTNKIRFWQIVISLFDEKSKKINIVDIDMEIKNNWYTEYFTNSGYLDMKITKSSETKIISGKNIGKKNETNVLSQAISESNSKYNLKIRAGYSNSITTQESQNENNDFPFPMALSVYRNHKSKVVYPIYVQPKLDGIRMIAKLVNGNIHLSSRRHKEITGFDHIKEELKLILKDENIIIDGELYSHGMDLQQISGIVRNISDTSNKLELQYYIFDIFAVEDTKYLKIKDSFEKRQGYLNSIIKESKYLVFTETQLVSSEQSMEEYYEKKISEGYEGIVLKSKNKPYEFSFNKEKRSMYNLKKKAAFDGEFKIVGYTEGKGKDKGCVIFICETEKKVTFNSVPNGDYDYRKKLYQDCKLHFDKKYLNKFAKLYYEDLSKDGVPLRNRMIQVIRDLQFD
jgi:hypothetical protein